MLYLGITILKGACRNLSQKKWLQYNSTKSSIKNLKRIPLDHTTLPGILRTLARGIRSSKIDASTIDIEWYQIQAKMHLYMHISAYIQVINKIN